MPTELKISRPLRERLTTMTICEAHFVAEDETLLASGPLEDDSPALGIDIQETPMSQQTIQTKRFKVKATMTALGTAARINLRVNGNLKITHELEPQLPCSPKGTIYFDLSMPLLLWICMVFDDTPDAAPKEALPELPLLTWRQKPRML